MNIHNLIQMGFPGGSDGKESAYQCRRTGFDTWVRKIFCAHFICVFFPPLLNSFCFGYIRTISVLYCAHHCMIFSLGICDFLEEISRLSNSIDLLYLLALITEEGFISPCNPLGLFIQMCIVFFFPFVFSFTPLLSSLWGLIMLPFCISFSWGWSWSLSPVQCHEPHSIVHQALLSIRSRPKSISHFHCIIIRDLI